MYPDGRTNPTPSHFARNKPAEMHPPLSPRLIHQRRLDREGRAICRIVYSHGIGIEAISRVFCVSEDTVIQALDNPPTSPEHDKAENDHWYVSAEYRKHYPPLSGPGASNKRDVDEYEVEEAQPNEPSKIIRTKKAQTSDCRKGRRGRPPSSDEDVIWLRNPTARDFKDDQPVTNDSLSICTTDRLDRKGRAICRIMYPYLQSYTKIGFIFGITHTRVRRAVLNDYTPPDDITEDYDYVGRDFKKEYPALSANGHSADKRPRSPELDDISESRPKRRQVAPPPQTLVPQKMPVVGPPVRPVIKVPQEIPVVEVPVRPKAVDPGAAVKSFLKNVGGFDLSHWQDTFKAKGLHTMGDLKTLASLEESRLVKTLTRLFADKKMAELHIILLADALLDLAKDVA